MTRTEQQEQAELGLNEQTIRERQQRLAPIIAGTAPGLNAAQDAPAQLRQRKPRSDKGKPKPKPSAPVAGVLTEEQVAHLEKLRHEMMVASAEASNAGERSLDAEGAYFKYLDLLTAK